MTLDHLRADLGDRGMDNIRGFYREADRLLTYAENQKNIFLSKKNIAVSTVDRDRDFNPAREVVKC